MILVEGLIDGSTYTIHRDSKWKCMKIKLTDILSWGPHEDFTEDRIRSLIGGDEIDALDALDMDVSIRDRMWVVMREEVIGYDQLIDFKKSLVQSVVHFVDEVNVDPVQLQDDLFKISRFDVTESQKSMAVAFAVKMVTNHFPSDHVFQLCSLAGPGGWEYAALQMAKRMVRVKTNKLTDIEVRTGNNSDGPAIRDLTASRGFLFDGLDMDWSQIFPYWLVSERNGVITGCIQVSVSKPVGRLEILCVDPMISKKDTAQTVKMLTDYGVFVLRLQGCSAACGMIPKELESYKKVALRRGWEVFTDGDMLIKAL